MRRVARLAIPGLMAAASSCTQSPAPNNIEGCGIGGPCPLPIAIVVTVTGEGEGGLSVTPFVNAPGAPAGSIYGR
jgi:hypothetical protein